MHSFAFDAIYWQKIDQRFFGPTESPGDAWKESLDLLDEKQKADMEQLVARKLEEMKTRALAWDPDEYTVAFREEMKRREETQNVEEGKVVEEDEDHASEKNGAKDETEIDADIRDKLATTHLSS